jgi:hypothetical protein
MSKTTGLTFIAAVILLAVCVAATLHRHRIVEDRISAGEAQFLMYDGFDVQLDSWERLAGLTGLLAFGVTLAGALMWDRETSSQAQWVSVLGLEERARRRTFRAAVPRKITAAGAVIRVDESLACLHEEEYLTPLERVIRGY